MNIEPKQKENEDDEKKRDNTEKKKMKKKTYTVAEKRPSQLNNKKGRKLYRKESKRMEL